MTHPDSRAARLALKRKEFLDEQTKKSGKNSGRIWRKLAKGAVEERETHEELVKWARSRHDLVDLPEQSPSVR